MSKTQKTVEERYQKKSQHEHVLLRPDMYIGSVKSVRTKMWVCDTAENKIIYKEIKYVPGLYKIFDEILVNVADEKTRTKLLNLIKVDIDQETGRITIYNNGRGIINEIHKEHNMYVCSLIFGELLSGENYDDSSKKVTGGKNGLGSKLSAIFSQQFDIDNCDGKKRFKQTFTNNLYNKSKPKVTNCTKKGFTKISFIPDFEKFSIKGISNDIFALFKKRVYDLAMTTGAKVYFNGEAITPMSFPKYVDLYFPDGSEHVKVIDITTHNRWKIAVVYDPTDEMESQNISFVNSICTNKAGTHVAHIVNQVVNKLKAHALKKCKNLKLKAEMIKENLIFFVVSTIEDPEFNSQIKEELTSKPNEFGSKFIVSDLFIKKVIKTGIIDQIIANAQAKAEASLIKADHSKGSLNIPKLYDAHNAGTKGCSPTLFLTEGDSARAFALVGFNEIGRENFGVFPLRGKLKNIRGESITEISANEEITAIRRIVGLVPGKKYTDTSELRYSKIALLTDQDVDGFHIRGLIMNYIHYYWPSLLKNVDGFIQCLNTPIVKMIKGKGKKQQVIVFHSLNKLEEWKKENNDGKGWEAKYFKGLATSDKAAARECFMDYEKQIIDYCWGNTKEGKEIEYLKGYKPKNKDLSEDAMTLAFAKKRENDRKEWINLYDPTKYLDSTIKKITYAEFIHKELIAFSSYDVSRAIPNIMDGFKPSHRKIYYGSVKKNIYNSELRVATLGGYIIENTAYHHGETSMYGTIIGMAQNFVGSNNLNLFVPSGQFGTRLVGGSDAGSPRYIHTYLDMIGKKIFNELDFDVLHHQQEDNEPIEPAYYCPIIPMILVNGSKGIGTGYSTTIEPCNPRDIFNNLKRIIAGDKPKPMEPWYRNFTGTVEKIDKQQYLIRGKYDIINDNTIHVTDLPIGLWTDKYIDILNKIIHGDKVPKSKQTDKKKGKKGAKGKAGSKTANNKNTAAKTKAPKPSPMKEYVKSYSENCTDVRVSFTITFYPGKLQQLIKSGNLEKDLKLVTSVKLSNMHLFNEQGKVIKYESYGAILNNFAQVRLELYQTRKDYLLGKWNKECDILRWKMKFIDAVINGEIIIFKKGTSKKKEEVIAKLEELGYPQFIVGAEKNASYNYLTDIKLFSLTKEEVEKLRKMLENKEQEIGILESKTPSELWNEELDDFMEAYEVWDREATERYRLEMKSNKKTKAKKTKK